MSGTGDGTVRVTPKPWYQSTTVYLNAAAFVGALGPLFLGLATPLGIDTDVALKIGTATGGIAAVINLFVRVFLTGAPISGTPAAGKPPDPVGQPRRRHLCH